MKEKGEDRKHEYREKKQSKHALMIWFVATLGILLAARLFMLTVVESGKWQSYADDASLRTVYETAPRGDILDRNGAVLATSRPVFSVHLSRVNLTKEKALETASRIMDILTERNEDIQITQQEIRQKIEAEDYDSYLPILLAENISEETAEKIKAAAYSGIQISTDYVRTYPNGSTAAHVIGYLGRISSEEEKEFVEEKGYQREALIGKDGIEKLCEEQLKGTDAASSFRIDSTGQVREQLKKTAFEKGSDVQLTIDLELQKTTEAALKQAIEEAAQGGTFRSEYGDYTMSYAKNAAVGAAVALDVKTGEVLAMASYPSFDPNDFAEGISEEKWTALQQENEDDPLSSSPLYNVATMSAVQPGSTFKPVTALAALSCGLNRHQYLYDDGYVTLGNRNYGCFLWNEKEEKHGYVDLKKAMEVSCNYYFYDIAAGWDFASGTALPYRRKISNETILDHARALGLGEKTGIEIAESAGTLPTETLKLQGIKTSLQNYLLAEQETYFEQEALQNRKTLRKKIEKIVNWADKDLTLEEVVGKLKQENFVKAEQIDALAGLCKYTYFDQTKWSQGDTFNIAIGQGDNAYTTLQMANYMATLGNAGRKNQVTLLTASAEKQAAASSVEEDDVDAVVDAMLSVTQEQGGSLFGAFASFPYAVAAKTGTAQRAGYISTEEEREYLLRHLHLIAPDVTFEQVEAEAARLLVRYPDVYESEGTALRRAIINLSDNDITSEDIDRFKEEYDSFAWTVALAPAEDPQIAVAVMLVQGKTSSNAAPVAREIIGKYGENAGWERSF